MNQGWGGFIRDAAEPEFPDISDDYRVLPSPHTPLWLFEGEVFSSKGGSKYNLFRLVGDNLYCISYFVIFAHETSSCRLTDV